VTEPGVLGVQCTEVWGGAGACDVSVKLAGARGEVFSQPYRGGASGGDIHFLSVCGMNILSKVVLADVSGHGVEVGEVARIVHDALAENVGAHDNSSMLRRVNEAFLSRRRGRFRFTTMVATILDNRDRSLVYAYAGHPSLLRGRAATGRFEPIRPEGERRGSFPLGVVPGTEFEQYVVRLEKGDALIAYTDAFTESRGLGGERIGEGGLLRLLEEARTLAPAPLKEHLLSRLGREFEDDASLVVLEIL
jgi:sigma-B regulation protein RsbU (phosphoserine phosphatase)